MTDRKEDAVSEASARERRLVILAVQVIGVAVIAFGVLADFLGVGSRPGIGLQQIGIMLAGAALIAAVRISPRSVGRIIAWARSSTDAMDLRSVLLFALIIGITTGLAETALVIVERLLLNQFVRVGPNVVWMAPLGNAIVLAAIGLLLWLGGRLWRKLATPAFVGFVFFLIAADTVLHRYRAHGTISTEAKLILVVAIAWTIGRAAANRWAAIRPRHGLMVAVAALTITLLGGAAALQPWWKERSALAALPPAPDGRVNLILIILDTVRAASLSVYGYERPTTPELERFAQAGVVFDRAISPTSWTLPSHGTMFTGRHPAELQVDWLTPLDDSFPTLAEILSQAGYATAGFSANVGYVSAESGLARGFARFEDFVPTAGEAVRVSVMLSRVLRPFGLQEFVEDDNRGRKTAEDVNRAFLGWLDDRQEDRPFFAFLNYFDAHAPFYAPAEFDTLYGGLRPLKNWGPNLSEEEAKRWRDPYDRSLTYLDTQLGLLFRELERKGVLRNTVIVVSSDHGEHLGENGYMGHATTLYRPAIEVPLIFRGPGIPKGVRVASRVGLRDLPASLLELAKVDAQGRIPGQSLSTIWLGEREDQLVYSNLGQGMRIPAHYPNAQHALWSIYESDLHYIASSSGEEELYRISTDPGEDENLISSGSVSTEAASLRGRLREHLLATGQSEVPLAALPERQ